jgi:hypothetical protein
MSVHALEREKTCYRKKVWVVGNCQFPVVSSCVVTFVHVTHSETTWPASRDRTKRLVHRLRKRRHVLWQKALKEE